MLDWIGVVVCGVLESAGVDVLGVLESAGVDVLGVELEGVVVLGVPIVGDWVLGLLLGTDMGTFLVLLRVGTFRVLLICTRSSCEHATVGSIKRIASAPASPAVWPAHRLGPTSKSGVVGMPRFRWDVQS